MNDVNSVKVFFCHVIICLLGSELKATRYKLLDMLPDPRNSGLAMEQALSAYLALLEGLIEAPDGSGAPSKLRHALLFKWSHSLLGTVPQ